MAAVKGDNRTKLDTNIGANVMDTGENRANVSVIFDRYTAAALAAGSTIKVGDVVPFGSTIVDIVLSYAALGASSTLSVGDSASATRYINAISSASAGVTRLSLAATFGYRIGTNAGDNQIVITTAGAAITGLVTVCIEYAL
jgi:hypothetical protein